MLSCSLLSFSSMTILSALSSRVVDSPSLSEYKASIRLSRSSLRSVIIVISSLYKKEVVMRRMMIRWGKPEGLEMGDVLGHARLLVVHLVPHRLQLAREGFLNFGALQTVRVRVFYVDMLLTSLSWLVSRWFCSVSWVIRRLFSFSADLWLFSVCSSKARRP